MAPKGSQNGPQIGSKSSKNNEGDEEREVTRRRKDKEAEERAPR